MADSPSRAELDRVVDLLREDLRNVTQDLKRDVKVGFDGVHERLDTLNSKTADHAIRIVILEKAKGQVDLATLLSILATAAAVWALFL